MYASARGSATSVAGTSIVAGGTLPFTGLHVTLLLVTALAFIGAGVTLLRLGRGLRDRG